MEGLSLGGVEVLLSQALPRLLAHAEVRVVALAPPDVLGEGLRASGVPTMVLNQARLSQLELFRQLRQLFAAADIVHTHGFRPTLYARMVRLSMVGGPSLVTTLHSPYYANLATTRAWRRVARFGLDWSLGLTANDAIVAVSDAVAKDFQEHLGHMGVWGRIQVIHNAIDSKTIAEHVDSIDRGAARRRLGFAAGQLAVVSIGRLIWEKNYIALVACVSQARAAGVDVRALVLGDGPDRAELSEIGGEHVVFRGKVSRQEVFEALAACDLYAQPSRHEAFGLAILEAMAAARPVVATAVHGIPEVVVADETGILVPLDDPKALTQAIIRMARDPALRQRLGSAGQQRARDVFALEDWVSKTEELYRGCKTLSASTPIDSL